MFVVRSSEKRETVVLGDRTTPPASSLQPGPGRALPQKAGREA